ncbi:acetate--CoA ligase [Rothia kristinae]|uniref:acetate--CoA ligase n=1 Tax=Rothia kristinae TaxID=37923 RepID=UPI001E550B79|nr:acetate--CoA ligase [Rothia kristinae]MCT1357085.1 acetate--CoA ligase [Rothia kristinae]MCT1392560.1 acetate--CoA ligase [Rothia kristinae]MCT1505148.1 acetate--CoA ligase [Rothia kristinae]MCT2038250.1 acetate--CoA ligase [Rothia kristinae]MCT2242753.1 acetate--CoA ligase [Rothia kristinae]
MSENAQVFPPSEEFAAQANATAELYEEAQRRGDEFWAEQARTLLHWDTEFTETLDWSTPPFAKWFQDGRLNAAYNAVDRHVEAGHGDRVALYFEGEPGDTEEYTYARLKDEVCRAANAFAELGVGHGDRVAVYLPMIPQAVITMLACARLGAIHSVIFGGFSADAIHSRVNDGEAKLVVTADGSYRRGKPTRLKPTVDAALAKGAPSVEHVLVVRRNGEEIEWTEQRDVWWHDVVDRASAEHTPQPHGAEDPLFILYTSGTTGKPKGILHTTGGYLTQAAYTHRMVFDIKPETDVYWCTADVGWVTGHTYIVYGPLLNGTSQVIYEGTPDSPHRGRFWEIVDKYGVSILYTSPTAIRTMMKWGEQIPGEYSLESLRLLGTVGEAINPEAWTWFHRVIGHGRCPIVDTWWQTETGAIMISQLPGVTAAKPGSAQRALPGISAEVVDDFGQPLGAGESGLLALTHPWPSMLRTLWGDDQRFQDTYWSRFGERTYFAGDGARRDEDGDIWVLGRVDDVMNVSGHRLSTPEIESALVSHPAVAESAVVGAADETTGQAVIAFVILSDAAAEQDGDREELAAQIRAHVGEAISPIAKPKKVLIVPELPKTRSGKIMRRLLKDVAEDRPVGDTSTLADSTVMDQITRSLRS